jgi:diguanylate cyclase (GGDEF)-like protein
MLIPYLVSYGTLAIGLPFFQHASDVLVGHYMNSAVFMVISWAASRIGYHIYCDNYVNKTLMKKSNMLLEKEMQENRLVNEKLAFANAQLKRLALVDELTGLSNRRGFREFIDQMVENNPDGSTVSMIMLDIDYFKQYNDCYGHEKGDTALIAVAQQIKSMLEGTGQIAVRWGGEEFIFAAFNMGRERIIEIAESIRRNVLQLEILNKSSSISPNLTVSLGTFTDTITSAKQISGIINAADKALYVAKNGGRNCVATLEIGELCEEEAL